VTSSPPPAPPEGPPPGPLGPSELGPPGPPAPVGGVPKRRFRLRWAAGAAGLLVLGGAVYVLAGLPSRAEVRALAIRIPDKTALMRQRDDEARRAGRGYRAVRVVVPLRDVSRYVLEAVIASEDQKFFGHEGVDWKAIQESVETDARKGRPVRGGSTITQQLAKNLFFGTRKTLVRKLRELVVARWLEADLSKARILTLYLNVIEWGDGIYGCEAAARQYYGKPAAALDLDEAAGLVGMIPAPRRLDPLLRPGPHARARRRVLWLMAHAGYIERSVAGLGAEPPPPEPTDGEDELPPDERLPAPQELPPSPEEPPPSPEPPEPEPSPDAPPVGL
jgi:monofunctional glycosyltransferase